MMSLWRRQNSSYALAWRLIPHCFPPYPFRWWIWYVHCPVSPVHPTSFKLSRNDFWLNEFQGALNMTIWLVLTESHQHKPASPRRIYDSNLWNCFRSAEAMYNCQHPSLKMILVFIQHSTVIWIQNWGINKIVTWLWYQSMTVTEHKNESIIPFSSDSLIWSFNQGNFSCLNFTIVQCA